MTAHCPAAVAAALIFTLLRTVPAPAASVPVGGTVSGPNGPLGGVIVQMIVRSSPEVPPLADVSVTTAADGTFEQQLPTGDAFLQFFPGESSGLVHRFVTFKIEGPARLRVVLSRTTTISGRMQIPPGASGTPVVKIYNLATQVENRREVDSSGTFNALVPAGRYSVQSLVEPPCGQEKSHNCHGPWFSRMNVDTRNGDVRDLTLPMPELDRPILPDRPPLASRISITPADADGTATVVGSAGAVEGMSTVLVANLQTLQFNVGASEADGSFSLPIFAPPGSMIQIKHDPTGRYLTQTKVGTGNNDGYEVAPGAIVHVPVAAAGTGTAFGTTSIATITGEANVTLAEFEMLGAREATRYTASGVMDSTSWLPGSTQTLRGAITLYSRNLAAITDLSVVNVSARVQLERLFDADGRQRQLHHQFMSSVLTPTGFPIERQNVAPSGTSIALQPLSRQSPSRLTTGFSLDFRVPADLPLGIYRPSINVFIQGIDDSPRHFDIFPTSEGSDYFGGELPLVRVGSPAAPRMYWVLGMNDFSNGTRGTVAIEERNQFRTALHVITPTEAVIWPRLHARSGAPKIYRLEPFIPMLSFAHARFANPPRFALQLPGGSLRVRVRRPDGGVDDLGSAPFAQMRNGSPMSRAGVSMSGASVHSTDFVQLTTTDPRFEYTFKMDGRHLIEMTGTLRDVWGGTYEGGGTYEVFVARPLQVETGVLAGTPFEIGNRINTAVNVTPPVPAEISLRFLSVNARGERRVEERRSRANRFGHATAITPFAATEDGEYRIDALATYVDETGNWWAGAVTWGSVVESPTTSMVARGRRGWHRGTTTQPAWFRVNDYRAGDGHVMYPFHTGDVKWMDKHDNAATIPKITIQDLTGTLTTRLRSRTAAASLEGPAFDQRAVDGELPLFSSSPTPYPTSTHPELVDQWGYFYGFAERPAVHVRSIVSEDDGDNGYWRFNENYQNQLSAGLNGDLPNDFKFLFGGAVYRDRDISFFGAYASLFVLVFDREKLFDGRIMPPFQGNGGGPSGGPLFTLKGKPIDIFFHPTGVRPGTILHRGERATFAGYSAPTLPSKIQITVTSPSGLVRVISGQANKIGYFYDPGYDFRVYEEGVWKAKVKVWFDGMTSAGQVTEPFPTGDVLGSREGEFYFYVVEAPSPQLELTTPAGASPCTSCPRFVRPADGPITFTITPPAGLANVEMYTTTTMPGFILEEGRTSLQPPSSSLSYVYDALRLAKDFPNLDLHDADGFAGVDTITISFLLSGTDGNGDPRHFARQIVIQGEELQMPEQKETLLPTRRRSVRR